MRFAAYAGTSVVLATGTIVRAFYERANFYSAAVAIAQSNASLMILTNVALLGVSMLMLGLQRLFYGPLRPIEVEQLYEKAWFAITETCLAMTIFREEVGGWFLVMFVSLLIGKVWGWIGEGRVEILEQQPPANPRLFHAQLSVSLVISSLFDILMLQYAVNTVLRHARPNMMVMFAFEFAVLTVSSLSTAARYGISVFEASVIRKQINERRAQIRRNRQEAQLVAAASEGPDLAPPTGASASEEDIDTMDIDAPGWEEKGRWIFYLDLTTDFLKLVLYLTFFCVLCMFYGMPIHIIRDVALTIRSFYKRITDFVRYRQATRDMNARYPDATPEEVAREDVCIICREDMRAWPQAAPQNDQPVGDQANSDAPANPIDERSRPKRLPCGHILHFACLRSWLERQQNCPTCRRPVLVPETVVRAQPPIVPHQQARAQPQNNPNPPQLLGQAGQNPIQPHNVYQFGPLRIAFGARQGPQGAQQIAVTPAPNQQAATPTIGNLPRNENPFVRQATQTRTIANFSPMTTSTQLQQIEQQLMREINGLRLQHDQLYLVRALQGELMRLRLPQANSGAVPVGIVPGGSQNATVGSTTQPGGPMFSSNVPSQSGVVDNQHLPTDMTIPEGWTVLPLHRLSGNSIPIPQEVQPSSIFPTTGAPQSSTPSSSQPQEAPETTTAHVVANATEQVDTRVPVCPDDNIRSTPLAATGGMDRDGSVSVTGHPSNVAVASSADTSSHPAVGIPNWGSGPATSGDEPTTKSSAGTDTSSLGCELSAENPAEGTRDKGKGKATTMENGTEDDN